MSFSVIIFFLNLNSVDANKYTGIAILDYSEQMKRFRNFKKGEKPFLKNIFKPELGF